MRQRPFINKRRFTLLFAKKGRNDNLSKEEKKNVIKSVTES